MDNRTIADFEEKSQLNIEKIIENYNAYIATILRNCMSNEQDIEEVLSDVFMILWKNQERFDKAMKIKPYLVGITKNLVRKKYRITMMNCEDIENYEDKVSDYINVENLIEENEKGKIVQDVIDEMKTQEKQIFEMFYYESKKVREIAKRIGISEVNVKVTLHRLRKLMKKKLKERGYGYGKS